MFHFIPTSRGGQDKRLIILNLQSATLVKQELSVGGDYGIIASQRRTSRRPCERTKRSVLQRGLSMVRSEGDNNEGQASFTVDELMNSVEGKVEKKWLMHGNLQRKRKRKRKRK